MRGENEGTARYGHGHRAISCRACLEFALGFLEMVLDWMYFEFRAIIRDGHSRTWTWLETVVGPGLGLGTGFAVKGLL